MLCVWMEPSVIIMLMKELLPIKLWYILKEEDGVEVIMDSTKLSKIA